MALLTKTCNEETEQSEAAHSLKPYSSYSSPSVALLKEKPRGSNLPWVLPASWIHLNKGRKNIIFASGLYLCLYWLIMTITWCEIEWSYWKTYKTILTLSKTHSDVSARSDSRDTELIVFKKNYVDLCCPCYWEDRIERTWVSVKQ